MTEHLDRSVASLVTGSVRSVHASLTLRDAAEAMSGDEIGLLVVVSPDGRLVGVLSERDLVRAVAAGTDLDGERVDARMADDVMCLGGDAPVRVALHAMVDGDVRHLVVVDDRHRPTGVVSSRDVMRVLGDPVGTASTP